MILLNRSSVFVQSDNNNNNNNNNIDNSNKKNNNWSKNSGCSKYLVTLQEKMISLVFFKNFFY
jgi:hypothetical protein